MSYHVASSLFNLSGNKIFLFYFCEYLWVWSDLIFYLTICIQIRLYNKSDKGSSINDVCYFCFQTFLHALILLLFSMYFSLKTPLKAYDRNLWTIPSLCSTSNPRQSKNHETYLWIAQKNYRECVCDGLYIFSRNIRILQRIIRNDKCVLRSHVSTEDTRQLVAFKTPVNKVFLHR